MKKTEDVKGRGFKRKTNLGLLCGIALAGGAMILGGQSVSADEVSTQPSTETAVSPETSVNNPNTPVETKPTTEVKPTAETSTETPKTTEGKKVVVDNGLTKLASELEALGAPITKEETKDLGVAKTDTELSSLKTKAESEVATQLKDLTDLKAKIQEDEKVTSARLENLRKQLGDKALYKNVASQLNYLQDEDYLNKKTELTNITSSKGSVTYANNSKDEANLYVDDVKANYFSTEGFVESDKPKSIRYSLFKKDKFKESLVSAASPIQDKTHANGIPVFLKEGESVTYDVKFAKDSKLSQLGISYKRVTVTLKSRGAKETSVPHTLTFLTSHGSSEEAGGISHNWNYKDAISGKPFETEVTYDYFNDKGVKISNGELGAAVYNKIVFKDNIVDNTFFSKDSFVLEQARKESKTYHDYTYRNELGGEHFLKITDRFFSNQGDEDALANFTVHAGEPLESIDASFFRKPEISKVSYHLVSYTDNRNADANPNNPVTPKVKGSVVQKFVSDKGIELAKSTSTGEKPEGEALNLTHPKELTYEGKTYVFVKQDKETPNKIVKGEVVVTYTYKEKEAVKGSVTQKFVNDKGTEIAKVVKTGDAPEGTDLVLAHPKEITFQGKNYIFVSQDKPDPRKITKGEVVVTYTYKEKEQPKSEVKGSVVQKFVDDKGVELKARTNTGEQKEGSSVSLSHPNEITFQGKTYVFVSQDKPDPKAITKGETVVTYVYKEKPAPVSKGSVTQKFVDDKGKEISNSVKTGDKPEGSDLNLTHPKEITFQGKAYVFVKQDKETPKKVVKGEVVVTYTYKEKEQPKPTPTVEITTIFVDENGKEISPKEKGTQPPKQVEGYVYNPQHPKNKEDKNGETVRVYKKVQKGGVVQHFVNEEGSKIAEPISSLNLEVGSKLELKHPTEITHDGKTYVFVKQDKATPTEVLNGLVEVTYTYKLKEKPTPTPTPTVESTTIFVDEEGKEISPKEKGTQPPKAIEGYEYDSTNPKNKEDKEGETVRVYKKVKYGTVVQRFVDGQGKELQSSVRTGRLKLGSKLDLTFPKELTVDKDKYTFKSQDKETPKEVTSEGELVITYVYAKEVAPVVPTTPTETPSKPSTVVPSVPDSNGVVTTPTTNVNKAELPNTGSGDSVSAAIAGVGLLTLVALSGRRTKED